MPAVPPDEQPVRLQRLWLHWTLGLLALPRLNVVAQFRVMPTGIDVDLGELMENIRASLPENTEVEAFREVDIAFGLKALVINMLLEDKAGGTTPIEEAIEAQSQVESVEVVGVTRI
jgi:elongation factor 1-beta